MRLLFCLLIVTLLSCKKKTGKPEITKENGVVVQSFDNPSISNSQTPNLFSNTKGLWMSWLHTIDSTDYLKFSQYKNGEWTKTTTVTSGNDWFVNWADFPAIAVNNGNVLTNILQKSDSATYTYDVKLNLKQTSLNLSQPDSISWIRNVLLHDDGTKSEHGFVSLQPYGDNSFYAAWLDGRNTGGNMDHDNHTVNGGAMTLRGSVISNKAIISNAIEIDNRVCDCCQTDLIVTKDNQVVVAYRDRSIDEIRDIRIKKWNKKEGWSSVIKVGDDNWKIAGCPVNGPALASFNNDYAVAWYTEAKGEPKVQLAFGSLDTNKLEKPIAVNNNPTIGRIDLKMISETEAIIIWIENLSNDTHIQLSKVDRKGKLGRVITVSKTNAARASGFPRMAIYGNNLVIAYTIIEKGMPSRIETKKIAINTI